MEDHVLEETILRKVMKNVPFGLIVSREGLERKVYYVNQTACDIMGYSKEEYTKAVERGWTHFTNVDLRELIRQNNEKIRNGQPFEVISKAITKSGEAKWLLNHIVVQIQEEGTCYVSFIDITERIEQEQLRVREQESLKEMAQRDSFTKLLNRGTMEEQIENALKKRKEHTESAYITIDVDNFKRINDLYGHGAGDMLILALAKLLTDIFGRESYVGRMGGDEFAVFVRNVKDREAVYRNARKVMEGICEEGVRMNLREDSTVSIGIAYTPEAGYCFKDLYYRADEALYEVKKHTKNGIAVFQI